MLVIEAVDVVDVHRPVRVRGWGRWSGGEKIRDEENDDGGQGLEGERPSVVAQSGEQPQQHEGKPSVKQGEPPQKQGKAPLEHVVGYARHVHARHEPAQQVDHPQHLRQRDGHRLHADEERALDPDGHAGDEQGDVTEVEKVPRGIRDPVPRYEDGHEDGVGQLHPPGNAPADSRPHEVCCLGWREAGARRRACLLLLLGRLGCRRAA